MLADLSRSEFAGIVSPAFWIVYDWLDNLHQTTGSAIHTFGDV